MSFLGQEEQLRELQDRFRLVRAFIFIGFCVLVSRLVYLQIFTGDTMRQYSEENRIKNVRVPAPRGMIFDRHRVLLIDNQPSFDLEVTPQYLRDEDTKSRVISLLAPIIGMKPKDIEDLLDKAKHQPSFLPIKIKTELTRDEVAQTEAWRVEMPGVAVKMEIKRTNIHHDIASHFLGYIAKINTDELARLKSQNKNYKLGDVMGKVGIEKTMEEVLRGDDGFEVIEVDALGRRIRESGKVINKIPDRPAKPGKNLILTVDQELQLTANEAFADKVGALVALNPKTGEILSMISRPSFNPTEFSLGISPTTWKQLINDENRPLRDKVIQDHYMPGSTFKVISLIAGLMSGAINKQSKFFCSGKMQFGNRLYHCYKKSGHGEVGVAQALEKSCDIFFYRLAQKLNSVDDISTWSKKFGLGQLTDIQLAREVPGLIPTENWKRERYGTEWIQGETLSVAIGQSYVLTTILQLANLYATIGNGGTLYRPFYLKRIENSDGETEQEFSPEIVRQIDLDPDVLQIVKEGLFKVVNSPSGTAYAQRLPGMNMAGKTGTAQVVRFSAEKIYATCQNLKYRFRHHGLFAAYAPAEDPQIAVAIIAEHACSGSGGAAPIAKAVIKRYLEKTFPEKYPAPASQASLQPVKEIERPEE